MTMMTKKNFMALFLCLFVFACAGVDKQRTSDKANNAKSSSAVNNQEKDQREITVSSYSFVIKNANMRRTANKNSQLIMVLRKGEMVEKIEDSGEWTKVRSSSGKTGWVFNKLLSQDR